MVAANPGKMVIYYVCLYCNTLYIVHETDLKNQLLLLLQL